MCYAVQVTSTILTRVWQFKCVWEPLNFDTLRSERIYSDNTVNDLRLPYVLIWLPRSQMRRFFELKFNLKNVYGDDLINGHARITTLSRTIEWTWRFTLACLLTATSHPLCKCPLRQHFYFPIWSYNLCNELRRNNFSICINRDIFMNWKTWKSYFLAVDPCRRSQDAHTRSSDVDSGTCDFKLDLSLLF